MSQIARYLLVFLGIAQCLGRIFGMGTLARIGMISSASPAPLVFNQFKGIEYWAADFEVTLSSPGTPTVTQRLTSKRYAAMPGPHFVHIAYGIPFSVAPISPQPILMEPLRAGFCKTGYLARLFGAHGKVESATILMTPKQKTSETPLRLTIPCP